jgi:hypothetical protein
MKGLDHPNLNLIRPDLKPLGNPIGKPWLNWVRKGGNKMKVKISLPNDYNSHEAERQAIDELYGGNYIACSEDEGRLIFDELANIAKAAGLKYVRTTEYGAIWEGKLKSIKSAINNLPRWAQFGEVA